MSRKKERELAFTLIFEKMFSGDDTESILNNAILCRDFNKTNYIENVFLGVYNHLDEIDNLIKENISYKWTIERITKTTLAILRLAIYEIKFIDDIPNAVSINEAVELTKLYGADGDYSFVNAVLGKIAKNG